MQTAVQHHPVRVEAYLAEEERSEVRHEYPQVLIEVLSPSTERVGRREKSFAYPTIASREEYVLVAQPAREVTVFRRGDAWRAEKSAGIGDVGTLNSRQLELPLAAIYEGH